MAKSTSNLFKDSEEKLREEAVTSTVEKEEVEVKAPSVVEEDVQDIDLEVIKKKKFRINGDNSKIIELNTSDLNIVTRLGEAYPRLNTLMESVQKRLQDIPTDVEDVSEEDFQKVSSVLKELDQKMREEVDFIFNEPVSAVCGADGNMWDPIEGSFRYEHIIEKLSKLYETNLNEEFRKMKAKIANKTAKYTGKKATKSR